jgi:hypothetical protein
MSLSQTTHNFVGNRLLHPTHSVWYCRSREQHGTTCYTTTWNNLLCHRSTHEEHVADDAEGLAVAAVAYRPRTEGELLSGHVPRTATTGSYSLEFAHLEGDTDKMV